MEIKTNPQTAHSNNKLPWSLIKSLPERQASESAQKKGASGFAGQPLFSIAKDPSETCMRRPLYRSGAGRIKGIAEQVKRPAPQG
jgi:hypothetical protein